MGKKWVEILGVRVSCLSLSQVLEEIKKYLKKGDKIYQIFTPNPEILVLAQKDKEFVQILNSADLALPDGQGVIWASRFLGEPLPERITGTDLAEKLAKLAAKRGLTIGLIGGGPQIAVKTAECLKKKYPGLSVWAEEGPWISNEKWEVDEWITKIEERKTNILFVGMGAPKQEYFINNLKFKIENLKFPMVLMAVGGAFDYLAGAVPRAPTWMQKAGLEWLFRLLRQPWRIRRQLSLLEFIFLVLKQKILK